MNQLKPPKNKTPTKSCKSRQERQLILITAVVPTKLFSISDVTERESREKIVCNVEDEKRFFSQFDFLQEIYPFSPLSS